VLKKPSRNSREDDAVDVPADNPTGTMRRFNAGLRHVLTRSKQPPVIKAKTSRPRNRRSN
jgi:hypothetical protein